MTEEVQTQQQTQQSQQQQPQSGQPQQKQRLGPNDYRNSEFVTKLMAANPPYLYSPAIGPHNFFFSEMLRSLVANKRNESLRNAEQLHHQQQQQQQQHQQQAQAQTQSLSLPTRRPRKRSWSQHRLYPESHKESKEPEEKVPGHPEKPLELTNKLSAFSRNITPKYEEANETYKSPKSPPEAKIPNDKPPMNSNLIPDPPTGAMPPSDLILPPPPPVWYPPLYPPYGIDPLHFFIDLRVSGHIYDRKKELTSPNSDGIKNEHSKLIGANDRQGSAFSVPRPREGLKANAAINLSSPPLPAEGDEKPPTEPSTLFMSEFKENKYDIIKNTNYVMQNLPRIYGDLNTPPKDAGEDELSGNLSDDQRSVGSNEDCSGEDGKFRDADLNVISDEDESIAVDEN